MSHRDFCRDLRVTYPVGIHLLVRWWRDLVFWIRTVGMPGFRDEQEHKWWKTGYEKRDEITYRTVEHLHHRIEAITKEGDEAYRKGWKACAASMYKQLDEYITSHRGKK